MGKNGNGDDSDPDRDAHVEHTYGDDVPASVAIIQAISAIENVEPSAVPTDLGITLYDTVDPDALDRLVGGEGGGSVVVEFDLGEYRIYVENTGRLLVCFH